jgi:hypothetical protein
MVAVLGLQIGATQATVTPPASGFGEVNRVGASVNFAGHATIPTGSGEDEFRYFDEQLRAELGLPAGTKVLAGPHRYQSGVPSNWTGITVNWARPDYNWGLQNMQISSTSWSAVAGGSLAATVPALIASVPDDFTLICAFAHEPENNGPMPNSDGGTWQNTNGPNWSRMQATLAEYFVTANRPNVWMTVIHMGDTFPANGQPGSLGNNQKDPAAWNPWQYMSAAAKARTIFGPDFYTRMTDDLGTSSSYTKYATKLGTSLLGYVQAAGWGVVRVGVSEHTYNNDIEATAAHRGAAIRDDMRVYLRGLKDQGRLAYHAHFNTSDINGASGSHGWYDRPEELSEFGALVREINVGSTGSGTTGVAFKAASTNTANTSTPSLPLVGATGDYAVVQFTCRDTITLTDPAGWTVHVSQDIGGGRFRVYGKFLAGTETTTNVVPAMSAMSRWAADLLTYSGVHATPINGTPGVATSTTSNTVHTTGTTTTTVTGCTILSLASDREGTIVVGSWTAPAGYTGRASVVPSPNAGGSVAAADKANQAIGTYGGDTWTTDVAAANFVGVTLALRPA